MGAYIARRLLGLIPLLLLISFAVFALVLAVPGDPARTIAGGLDASEDRVEEIREELDSTTRSSSNTCGGSATSSPATSARRCSTAAPWPASSRPGSP